MTATPQDEDQPYQLERRTAVLLGLGALALVGVGVATPILFGGSPCDDLDALTTDVRAGTAEPSEVDDDVSRGLNAFTAGDGVLVTRVVAAPSTQVDAVQRLDAEGSPVGECLDLAVITDLPAFLVAADDEAMMLLRADDEERVLELREPDGTLDWERELDVPEGPPGPLAVATRGELDDEVVRLTLQGLDARRRIELDRATGEELDRS